MPRASGHPEAIVRPMAAAQAFDVERISPREELAEFVDYHWLVRWSVSKPHQQQVVPQPRVHIAAEDGQLLVHGVSRNPFHRMLTECGHVLGTAFHAGGFRPLLKRSVSAISETVQPGRDLLSGDDRPVGNQILAGTESAEMIEVFERYLLLSHPVPDPTGREVTALVGESQCRRDIVRADQLAAHAGYSLRTLQRLFSEYVGIGPKWVIQRFRILDAAAAAHSGDPIDWSALAYELGFSDQAHLTRILTQVVGTPPAKYVRTSVTR
ncbi:AraC family transcriptional regulator [Rhodococcus sp. WMMA185]|uniref:helix-turn-helix domain-containing protein n=1 Tax=Rhodococcus sp. WMMA185 TaxID=679318 RepID=UPI000878E073|nr:helix-turn-helix domain-containing protein [Rhodococcus sp. WMMA185]AOW92720.1 AraC family transcriptional regulator [Rhodococcus sp. WMMA185]